MCSKNVNERLCYGYFCACEKLFDAQRAKKLVYAIFKLEAFSREAKAISFKLN